MVIKMSEEKTIECRNEILFLYDTTNANPNGDPYENKPRLDPWTERNIVSDTRLKRTVRDYLLDRKQKIFVRIVYNKDGSLKTKEELSEEIWAEAGGEKQAAIKKFNETFIDYRLFGATVPIGKKSSKNKSVHWTGPVQFKFGQSLHPVDVMNLKGTTVLPSKADKTMGTFVDFWYLPYSLVSFYGIANEEQAKNTGLTDDDLNTLMDAMWNGTKGLTSRSKFGQMPRLLVRVSYESHFHIGALDTYVTLLDAMSGKPVTELPNGGKMIRSVDEVHIDLSKLVDVLKRNAGKIQKIEIRYDESAHFVIDGKVQDNLLEQLSNIEEFREKVFEIKDKVWTAG